MNSMDKTLVTAELQLSYSLSMKIVAFSPERHFQNSHPILLKMVDVKFKKKRGQDKIRILPEVKR